MDLFHVSPQVTGLRKRSPALSTLIWPFARVCPPVFRERRAVTKTSRAVGTLIRTLARVRADVNVEGATLRKALVADDATIGLLAAVRAKMDGETVRLEEALVADVADVRLLLVVHALLVTAQSGLGGEIAPAFVAAEPSSDTLRGIGVHSGTGLGHTLPTFLVPDILQQLVEGDPAA